MAARKDALRLFSGQSGSANGTANADGTKCLGGNDMLDRTQLDRILELYNKFDAKADKAYERYETHLKYGNEKSARAQQNIHDKNIAILEGIQLTAAALGYDIVYQRDIHGEYVYVIVER